MELKISKKHRLLLQKNSYHFIVIGCGGNGSFLIRDLARFIAVKNEDDDYAKHALTVCDADIVELKNIKRQNFIIDDVGSNKAKVLAERYSEAYGMQIGCYDEYITTSAVLDTLCDPRASDGRVPVIIGCVDNNATRSIIAEFLYNKRNTNSVPTFWIDGGNEEFSGQVVFSYSGYPWGTRDGGRFGTPTVTQVYPEILEVNDKRPDQMSCDDRAVHSPQCIATNITVAALILCFCNHLVNMPNIGLESFMVNFDVKKINFGTTFNTDKDLDAFIGNPVWVEKEPQVLKIKI